MKLKPTDKIPLHVGRFVDVRDVAKAHDAAAKKPDEFNGRRLMLLHTGCSNELIAHIINPKFPDMAISKGLLKKHKQQFKEGDMKWDNSKTKALLGFELRCLEDSMVDTVKQIIEAN